MELNSRLFSTLVRKWISRLILSSSTNYTFYEIQNLVKSVHFLPKFRKKCTFFMKILVKNVHFLPNFKLRKKCNW